MKPKRDFSILREIPPATKPVGRAESRGGKKTIAEPQNAPETPPDVPQGTYSKPDSEKN